MKLAPLLILVAAAATSNAIAAEDISRRLVQAEAGDVGAMHDLCHRFLYGEDTLEKDPSQAFRWCSSAASAGVASAQTLLAEMYYFGTHVAKNESKAREYYLLAAEQGHVHAMLMLGHLAWSSEPPDEVGFCQWTRAAVLQGYEKAFQRLKAVEDLWREEKGDRGKGYCDSVLAEKKAPNNLLKGMPLRGTP